MKAWGGRDVEHARLLVARRLPAPCGKCGRTVTADPAGTPRGKSGWVVGHIKDRATHPHLTWQPTNWQPEHRRCSDRSGQSVVIAKAKREALAEAGILPGPGPRRKSPPLPVSLPTDPDTQGPQEALPIAGIEAYVRRPAAPVAAPYAPSEPDPEPFEVPEHLTWPVFVASAPAWLLPYLELGPTDNPPLAVSPVHPDAVGTYADQAVPWIEDVEKKTLRWWQRLGLALKLQHDADGRLLKRTAAETAPRRAGKSVGLRGLALWRMEHGPELFGERQEIVHTGSDLAVCRKAQQAAWRWSREQGWNVTKGNGKEAIETPDGDVWLVRAQEATYGWDTTLGLVDEGWDVKPDTVSEGIEPSLLGRSSPQLVLTSTSHRRARSTMRSALAAGLTGEDPRTLVLWWGAPPGSDVSDPAVWRAASPYWDTDRAEMVAAMYAKALAGENDPEFDDPDPMRGFACQYANLWDLKAPVPTRGAPVIEADTWAQLVADRPDGVPGSVAVEAWFSAGVSVAQAWRADDGTVVVSVADHPDIHAAVAAVAATGYRGRVRVGASIADNPAWRAARLRTEPQRAATRAVVQDLARLITDRSMTHDGAAHLTDQVVTLRTVPSADGVHMSSKGRADAVKAAVWAATARFPARRAPRILLPTR